MQNINAGFKIITRLKQNEQTYGAMMSTVMLNVKNVICLKKHTLRNECLPPHVGNSMY